MVVFTYATTSHPIKMPTHMSRRAPHRVLAVGRRIEVDTTPRRSQEITLSDEDTQGHERCEAGRACPEKLAPLGVEVVTSIPTISQTGLG